MNIEHNISLQRFNTLSVPSVARYYFCANSIEELRWAIAWSQSEGRPFYILGGGSNTIPGDFIDGLVIRPKIMGIHKRLGANDSVTVSAGAGESWHGLVMDCVASGLCGIENLALIPGDCGAAPIQNIGAYGVELKDVFLELEALNVESLALQTLSYEDCKFAYRDSVFKGEARGKYIITNVSLLLSTRASVNIGYKALKDFAALRGLNKPTVQQVAKMVIEIRESKLPDPAKIPNAGSFFKNPVVSAEKFVELQVRFPKIVGFPQGTGHYKIAAAWLLDTLGWKGKSVHGIKIHAHHALVLTNPLSLGANKILLATEEIVHDVKAAFGLSLEVEPQVLGVSE